MWGLRRSVTAIVTAAVGVACLSSIASAGNEYDGTYTGQITLSRGASSMCGAETQPSTKQVVNGQFSLVYDAAHHVGVNLTVQPDGSFSGSQQYMYMSRQEQVRASGKIAGNVMTAHIEGAGCSREYSLKKG
jgi:hypothetical protein